MIVESRVQFMSRRGTGDGLESNDDQEHVFPLRRRHVADIHAATNSSACINIMREQSAPGSSQGCQRTHGTQRKPRVASANLTSVMVRQAQHCANLNNNMTSERRDRVMPTSGGVRASPIFTRKQTTCCGWRQINSSDPASSTDTVLRMQAAQSGKCAQERSKSKRFPGIELVPLFTLTPLSHHGNTKHTSDS